MIDTVSIAAAVSAGTGVCTFLLAVYVAAGVRSGAAKVAAATVRIEDIHTKTEELVIHTNSLTTKLMEKTDLAGIAAGIKQEQDRIAAAVLDDRAAVAVADTMAKALIAAAEIAADKILAVAKLAKEGR